jgi:hypothetical protein
MMMMMVMSGQLHPQAALQLGESSVGIEMGWTADVRFPAAAKDFSLLHSVQTVSGAHPAACPIGTRGSFLWGKAVGA